MGFKNLEKVRSFPCGITIFGLVELCIRLFDFSFLRMNLEATTCSPWFFKVLCFLLGVVSLLLRILLILFPSYKPWFLSLLRPPLLLLELLLDSRAAMLLFLFLSYLSARFLVLSVISALVIESLLSESSSLIFGIV